jgi:hypothetical protein
MSGATTDTDLGAARFVETMGRLNAYTAIVGMWGEAKNAYGERIMTYGSAQAGARGRAPHWMRRALQRGNAWARGACPAIYDKIIDGASDVTGMIGGMAKAAADAFRSVPTAADLRESGALIESIDWETPDRKHEPHPGGTRTRIKRAFAKMTAAQQVYQLFHKGRSNARRQARNAVPFARFKERFSGQWSR